ncbi:MFS general substrate transporter [Punctularia strigosozonata HHB-11173 SS5]|uniref:MFS general substrate transporter n=1 Tax=Punctularia strigosozonata (strain HHB-11173) TaxID=741275 RepID=UPI0004417290|nr:MFS general substrate transporter [Punctularia strigosozonata HHB-11173 SS5]EIN14677.1 MFS general substrate transporter [Punctularia strigosozonata HHB-11173 SS5]
MSPSTQDDGRTLTETQSHHDDASKHAPETAPGPQSQTLLHGSKLVIACLSLFGCIFLVSLDQLILTTSSPKIVSDFNALDDIGWITTAYFVGQAAFMLIFGKILAFAPTKAVILVAIFLFEAGSAISGASPNMDVLLFGRTLQGVGAAGLFTGTFAAIANITTLHQRPRVMGMAAMVFALASVIGPLVGGAFADSSATWRWCFYINLPIGGLAAFIIVIIIPYAPAAPSPDGKSGWRRIPEVDFIGCLLVMGATVCFLVPLTTGGNTFAWDSAVVCTLFPLSAVFFVALLFWCRYRGERAVLPLFLLRNRSMIGASGHAFMIWGGMMISSVFLPYYLQAVKGVTATRSAIEMLPFTLVTTFSAAFAGTLISKTGHFWPWLVASPAFAAIGYGLLYTLDVDSSMSKVYGFQVITAFGIGASMQQNMLVPQVLYHDSPTNTRLGISLVSFIAFIGRSVAISTASAVMLNEVRKEVPKTLPNAPADILKLVESSVEAVRTLPGEYKQGAIIAYARALRVALVIGVPFTACSMLAALLITRQKMVKPGPPADDAEAKAAVAPVAEPAAGTSSDSADVEKH